METIRLLPNLLKIFDKKYLLEPVFTRCQRNIEEAVDMAQEIAKRPSCQSNLMSDGWKLQI